MTAAALARSFFAGSLLVNTVPHGVAGVQGRPFISPFGRPPGRGESSPVSNAVWASANAVAGVLLLRGRLTTRAERVALAAGAVTTALLLAVYFDRVTPVPRRRRR